MSWKLSELKLNGFVYDPNTRGECGEVYFNCEKNGDDNFICFISDMDIDNRLMLLASKSCSYIHATSFVGNEVDPEYIASTVETIYNKYYKGEEND